MDKRIAIVGAGPTGLGAAYHLNELGYKNWAVFEKNGFVGGHAASFVDPEGFTWDVGGHVLFSHYKKFDEFVETALGDDYLEHLRESWIRILGRWVPYPLQNNIRYLPEDALLECLIGLYRISKDRRGGSGNFKEWIAESFGDGIAKYFMFPYNRKVWSTPLEKMSKDWIADRVSVVDFERVLSNVILQRDDVSWGPNNTFKFPVKGGTGEIFRRTADRFSDRISFDKELERVDAKAKTLFFKDGSRYEYDALISTIPIDVLVSRFKDVPQTVSDRAKDLVKNDIVVVRGRVRPHGFLNEELDVFSRRQLALATGSPIFPTTRRTTSRISSGTFRSWRKCPIPSSGRSRKRTSPN